VIQVIPTIVLGALTLLVMPIWPWSKGWGWAPTGMLAMGLATLVLFSLSVEPQA
jgi:hypothetical protein